MSEPVKLTLSIRPGKPIPIAVDGGLVEIEAITGRAQLRITVTPPPDPKIGHVDDHTVLDIPRPEDKNKSS